MPLLVKGISAVISRALRDPIFRSQLIAKPKKILEDMEIPIPEKQQVTVLENNRRENFFVLPMITEEDVQKLNNSIKSVHPQRAIRSRILMKAWQDPAYKEKLFKSPKKTLMHEGMKIPPTTEITVVEDSETQLYLVLPCLH
jgi:hypothetical protein